MVGAAMELWARVGAGERGGKFGDERGETLLGEVGMRGRGNSALCVQRETA